jgi:hypothetical protein
MINYTSPPGGQPIIHQTTSMTNTANASVETTACSQTVTILNPQFVHISFWMNVSVGAPGLTRVNLRVKDGSTILNNKNQVPGVAYGDSSNTYYLVQFSMWVNLTAGNHTISVTYQTSGIDSMTIDAGALTIIQWQA